MIGKTNAISGGGTKPLITTIRIDQNISDPATMIALIEDTGGINAIRNNSHRYLAKKTADGEMTICQLDDNDSNYYADGSASMLTGEEGDVFMKLPKFYYRAVEFDADVWEISFLYGVPDDTFVEWDGNDLIGAYEAYSTSLKIYSRSNVTPTGVITQPNFKAYARNRGKGYSIVKWEHHCMMAFLFYAYYKNTNSQAICGAGTESYTKTTGITANLGMRDTYTGNGNSSSINFWGLENWWGDKIEFIDNVVSSAGTLAITTNDNTTRQVAVTTSSGYILQMLIGGKLDLSPKKIGGSDTTGYCDRAWGGDGIAARSYYGNTLYGGLTCLVITSTTTANNTYGSRLAFRGNIIEEKDSSVFKNIVALE